MNHSACPHFYSHTCFGSHKLCKHKCNILCVWHRHLYTHYTTWHHTHVERVSIQTWLKRRVSKEQHFNKKERFFSVPEQSIGYTQTQPQADAHDNPVRRRQREKTRNRSDTIGGSQSVYMHRDWVMPTFASKLCACAIALCKHDLHSQKIYSQKIFKYNYVSP